MRIVSIAVGRPREIAWKGEVVRTSIFKDPVAGPVRVNRDNLEGDLQADPDVHGGAYKAVYAYPAEHYAAWRDELPGVDLPWGAFGENLTIEGLLEQDVRIGDRLRAGVVEFVVTEPRLPCYKLALRLGRADIGVLMARSGRCGFYLGVTHTGEIAAGDALLHVPGELAAPTIAADFRRRLSRG